MLLVDLTIERGSLTLIPLTHHSLDHDLVIALLLAVYRHRSSINYFFSMLFVHVFIVAQNLNLFLQLFDAKKELEYAKLLRCHVNMRLGY